MPPQGDFGRGEACVIRERGGGVLLPLSRIRSTGCAIVVWGDWQVPGDELPLGIDAVETWGARAIH